MQKHTSFTSYAQYHHKCGHARYIFLFCVICLLIDVHAYTNCNYHTPVGNLTCGLCFLATPDCRPILLYQLTRRMTKGKLPRFVTRYVFIFTVVCT